MRGNFWFGLVLILMAGSASAKGSVYCEFAAIRNYSSGGVSALMEANSCRKIEENKSASYITYECQIGDIKTEFMVRDTTNLSFFQSFGEINFSKGIEYPNELKDCPVDNIYNKQSDWDNSRLPSLLYGHGIVKIIPVISSIETDETWVAWIPIQGSGSKLLQNDFLRNAISAWAGQPDKSYDQDYIINSGEFDDYEPSDFMVAGVKINNTDSADVENGLKARNYKLTNTKCLAYAGPQFGCVRSERIYEDGANDIGLNKILIIEYMDRVNRAIYYFKDGPSYTNFINSLDAKYGKSKLKLGKSCNERHWDSGSLNVDGFYCASDKDKFSIEIEDMEVEDNFQIARYIHMFINAPQKPNSKAPKKRPPSDMF